MTDKSVALDDDQCPQGFVSVPKAVLYADELTASARLVFCLLLGYAWMGQDAWPGQERLSEQAGIPVRSLRRYLRELEAFGLLATKRGGFGASNRYRLRLHSGQIGRSIPANLADEVSTTTAKASVVERGTTVEGNGEGATADAAHAGAGTRERARKPRARNACLDALMIGCGYQIDATTSSAWSFGNSALSEIKAVTPGVTPDEITVACDAMRIVTRGKAFTPKAIATWWGKTHQEQQDATQRILGAMGDEA